MNTFPIKLTASQAANFMRSQLTNNGGKDVLEHLIEIIGNNNQEMLDLAFQSIAPDFNPVGTLEVGDEYEIYRYSDFMTIQIEEINLLKIQQIKCSRIGWITAKELNEKIQKANLEKDKLEQAKSFEG